MTPAPDLRLHPIEPESATSIAARLLDECGGDRSAASKKLISVARRRRDWHEDIFRRWADVAIGEAARARNEAIRTPLRVEPTPTSLNRARTRAARFGAAVTHSILDYELRLNGKSILLKNATAEEVLAVAHHYLSQGTTMIRTGRWLERVAASVPDGKRVGEVLGVKELERLQTASRKEAA